MLNYNKSKTLFSIHIPKSGGTSFNNVLRKWFWPGFHSHYFRHDINKIPPQPPFYKKGLHKLGLSPLCVHGHFVSGSGAVFECYPDASQFISVIRDPLQLTLSMFFYHKKRLKEQGALYWQGKKVEMEYGGDIDKWVEERPCFLFKFFPWEINEQNYKEVVDKNYIHIGVTENLQKSIDIFAEKLGKKSHQIPHLNEAPRSQNPSETAIRKFKEKHKLEYEFYDYICSLNK